LGAASELSIAPSFSRSPQAPVMFVFILYLTELVEMLVAPGVASDWLNDCRARISKKEKHRVQGRTWPRPIPPFAWFANAGTHYPYTTLVDAEAWIFAFASIDIPAIVNTNGAHLSHGPSLPELALPVSILAPATWNISATAISLSSCRPGREDRAYIQYIALFASLVQPPLT